VPSNSEDKGATAAISAEPRPRKKLKPFFYDLAELPDLSNSPAPMPDEMARHFANAGGVVKQILNIPTLRVGYYKFEPGFRVPYHNHGANQLTFVLKGSLYYGGKKVTGEGMGFFTPGQDYAWIAGPEGAEILEIHDTGGRIETFFRDPVEKWPPLFFDWSKAGDSDPQP
jgi:hypothetical protein